MRAPNSVLSSRAFSGYTSDSKNIMPFSSVFTLRFEHERRLLFFISGRIVHENITIKSHGVFEIRDSFQRIALSYRAFFGFVSDLETFVPVYS